MECAAKFLSIFLLAVSFYTRSISPIYSAFLFFTQVGNLSLHSHPTLIPHRNATLPKQTISSLVNRACITKMTGYHDDGCSINVQGEQQKKLDVLTNDVLKKALRFTGRLTVLASEEEDAPVTMEDRERIYADKRDSDVVVEEGNKYVACFDPLDGSSNVDAR